MSKINDQIAKIAKDLLSLEINTIITECITAEKMPLPSKVILELIDWYKKKLEEIIPKFVENIEPDERSYAERFKEIETNIEKNMIIIDSKQESVWSLVYRIKVMSSKLAQIMEKVKDNNLDTKLNPEDYVFIRKAWEIGVEEIALQTIIQIDGDVVTRVNRKYANSNDESKILQAIHHQGVNVCMQWWKELINTARLFFESIFKAVWR